MTIVFSDIETDSLDPTVVWVIVTKELEAEPRVWTAPFDSFVEYARGVTKWVFHNGIAFDVPVINRLIGDCIDINTVCDTLVISRLLNYQRRTHNLDGWGESLGIPKGKFSDWSHLSDEMIEYCKQDVRVTEALYHHFEDEINSEQWAKSIWCEHQMAIICEDMRSNGFLFNRKLAEETLDEVQARLINLEQEFMEAWPPELRVVKTVQYRTKSDGTPYANVLNDMDTYPKTKFVDGMLECYDYIPFNPGSPKDRVDKLWESGWQPVEKTDGHYQHQLKKREITAKLGIEAWQKRQEEYDRYGWTCSEENLETLPADAPDAASALAQWLTLNGRKTALEERLRECEQDSRIRTKFWHIGAWTQRMSHSSPNLANISSPFHGEPKTAVEVVKDLYDAKMREMFTVPEGSWLVGTDAESIQLRVLAHYLRNDDYVHAILSGSKADGTDIHNLNRRALGLDGITRDMAKTFIYAWLLGAGVAKVSRILGCSMAAAKEAVQSFIDNTTGLGELKRGQIRRDAGRGYFKGLDGRLVINNSEYLMLAGYLQNGETIVMKHANILWREWANREKIPYKQVNFVHDEWQTEVNGSRDAAERLGQLQCRALTVTGERLGCYCPMAGETRIGTNWLETH